MAARTLVLMAGPPGTGKTTLATAIAAHTSAALLNKDAIRAALFAPHYVEYSTPQDDYVMRVMLQTAAYLFTQQALTQVILDGRTFSRRYQIEQCAAFVSQFEGNMRIIECTCSDESVRQRIEADGDSHLAANRSFALYQEIKARFEPITRPKLLVDTDQPLHVCLALCLVFLAEEAR